MREGFKCMAIELALGAALLLSALIFALGDFVFGPVAAVLMCGARFAICWVYLQTKHTFEATLTLFPKSQRAEELAA